MRFIYILCLIFTFSNCTSVPKEYLIEDKVCKYDDNIFKIVKEDLTFNKAKYDSLLAFEGAIVQNKGGYTFEIQSQIIGVTDNEIGLTKWIDYFEDGKIKRLTFFLKKSSNTKIGEETHYNDQGEVTKVIDHEKGYNICWAESIEIIKKVAKREIKKYEVTGFNLQRTDLNEFPNSKPIWRISLDGNDDYKLKGTIMYWIDGVTGEFLKTTKIIVEYD